MKSLCGYCLREIPGKATVRQGNGLTMKVFCSQACKEGYLALHLQARGLMK